MNATPGSTPDQDPNAPDRKKDHIALAFQSKVEHQALDNRFFYEPALLGHPENFDALSLSFLDKPFSMPVWVSSMTGGTAKASIINKNLAKACGEFGLGMGLGSCRQLLYSDEYLHDFAVRKHIGDQPLYANLGIAQIEKLLEQKEEKRIAELLNKLEADGLIIHINPLQEWLQPEGDRYYQSPVTTIKKLLDAIPSKVIVKEVGQGMGPESLLALMQLPVEAIDFAAGGGTNFAMLEILRSTELTREVMSPLAHIGHSATSMVDMVNNLLETHNASIQCRQVIISGGVRDFLDGYYLIKKINLPAVYGQASGFLKYATGDYTILQEYVSAIRSGLAAANTFLRIID